MKKIGDTSGYAHRLYTVELEGDETSYSDAKLMHMADNYCKVQDNWPEIEAGRCHPGHFGGRVDRQGNKAIIKVYTD
jgi:hypothetical protein